MNFSQINFLDFHMFNLLKMIIQRKDTYTKNKHVDLKLGNEFPNLKREKYFPEK